MPADSLHIHTRMAAKCWQLAPQAWLAASWFKGMYCNQRLQANSLVPLGCSHAPLYKTGPDEDFSLLEFVDGCMRALGG